MFEKRVGPRRGRRVAAVALLLLCAVLWAAAQEAPTGEASYYYTFDEAIPVIVSLDEIGVLAAEGVSLERLADTLSDYGLSYLGAIDGAFPLHRFGLAAPSDRAALGDLAARLRGEPQVDQAGLVVREIEGGAPIILTDLFVVQFPEGTSPDEIADVNATYGATIQMENPFVDGLYILRAPGGAVGDALDLANAYQEAGITAYAHPDFLLQIELYAGQKVPNDPLYPDQWHHENAGASGGTADADIDSASAWGLETGDPDIVIAVFDVGFDMTHPDLVGNLWANPGEIGGNQLDDDLNGFIDDVNGWDFFSCASASSVAGCGDNDLSGVQGGTAHGTAVAGTAAATGWNNVGVVGSCPGCHFLPLRLALNVSARALLFDYARAMGAAVISCSWGCKTGYTIPAVVTAAIQNAMSKGRGGLGCVVLFAVDNDDVDACGGAKPRLPSIPGVIGVGRSTNRDRFDVCAHGGCVDLLAPGSFKDTVSSGRGTLWATTTDTQGQPGFNANAVFTPPCPCAEPADKDYTRCFGGTSFATPLAAGVAGLVLSADGTLTQEQVANLLRDTADRVEDSLGAYNEVAGLSDPASGTPTHGAGRVNAFESVRVVAPVAAGGRGGVDLMVRDNRLDWGNTEQPSHTLFEATRGVIPHWESMDIKVDAPGFNPPTPAGFDAFPDETPALGVTNKLYVRVRNRGPKTATNVTVRAYWTQFGTALPALPVGFWTSFSASGSDWHSLGAVPISSVPYSGGVAPGQAKIATFDFLPTYDAALADHFCILVVVDSPDDPVAGGSLVVDNVTPANNNVTHRNYAGLAPQPTGYYEAEFLVRNPNDEEATVELRVDAPWAAAGDWSIELAGVESGEPLLFAASETRRATLRATPSRPGEATEIRVVQTTTLGERVSYGGITLRLSPERPESPLLDCVYDRLFERTVDGFILPRLVQFYEVSDDGLAIELHLRAGVFFHDGTELSAEAVKRSLEQDVGLLPGGVRPAAAAALGIDEVEIVDPLILRLHAAAFDPRLIERLAGVEGIVASCGGTGCVGSGPFELVELIPGRSARLVGFAGHFDGAPAVDELVFEVVPEETARLAGVRQGSFDLMVGSRPCVYEAVVADPSLLVCGGPFAYQAAAALPGLACRLAGTFRLSGVERTGSLRIAVPDL